MLKLFKSNRLAKAYKAIESNDLDKLQKQLQKLNPDEINNAVSDTTPPLAEVCIRLQATKALKLVLNAGADPDLSSLVSPKLSLTELALQQENSLPLLTALFDAGSKADPNTLLEKCFDECSEQEVMLHLSLFIQNGAELSEATVHRALECGDLALINFVFNSGAELPKDIHNRGYKEEVIKYAQKCIDDIKILQMFLG